LAPYHDDYRTVLATKTIKGIFCLRDVQPFIGIETQLIEFGTKPDFMLPEMSSLSLVLFVAIHAGEQTGKCSSSFFFARKLGQCKLINQY
jgi:hypothetical protein